MALPADPRTAKTTRPAAPTGLPATPTYDITALLAGLPKYPTSAAYRPDAHATAAAQTAATVRALRAQQAQINQQAALQAQQINQATLAGAGFLSSLGLGDKLQASLNAAAADQRAAASGYSGGLQQTMAGEAARVQQGLNAIGGPGGVPSTAAQAGNVLYGLGGDLPASAIEQYAPFAAAAERGRPQQTIGIGQQAAFGALGAGRQEAARLNPDIATAIAGRPALEADILSGLKKDAAAARADAIGNMWKSVQFAQDGNEAEATRAWRQAQLDAGEAARLAKAAEPKLHYGAGGEILQILPNGQIATIRAATPNTETVTDAKGTWLIDSQTGAKIARVGGPPASQVPSPPTPEIRSIPGGGIVRVNPNGSVDTLRKPDTTKKTVGNLSKSQVQHLRSGIAGVFFGVKEQTDADGNVTRAALPQGSYQDAIKEAILAGYSQADATKMANRFYKPGVRGRPGGATTKSFFGDPAATVAAALGNG